MFKKEGRRYTSSDICDVLNSYKVEATDVNKNK